MVLARWCDEVVLHAGIVQGDVVPTVPQLGRWQFEDVTEKAGLGDPTSKSLGVAVFDYNGDGWPDLFVANDTQPNKLYRNNRQRHVHRGGRAAGVAYGEDGVARGAMGADAADYDRTGGRTCWWAISPTRCWGCITTKATACSWMRRRRRTVGRASLLSLTFGAFFFDYDLDGHDIFAANGHIEAEIGRVQPKVQYRQPPLLFHNVGNGRFENVTAQRGCGFDASDCRARRSLCRLRSRWRSRLLISTNNGPAYLYRNDGGNRNYWLNVRLVGTKSNRSASVRSYGSRAPRQAVADGHSGSSYCSQSDLALTFGLGKDPLHHRSGSYVAERRASSGLRTCQPNQFDDTSTEE